MADRTLHLAFEEIKNIHKDLQAKAEASVKAGVQAVALATHGHVKEQAEQVLRSTREKFLNNLTVEPLGDDGIAWAITVKEPALFIEDGQPPYDMLDSLLKSPKAKTTKDGKKKYIVIPFDHSKVPTQTTLMHQSDGNLTPSLSKHGFAVQELLNKTIRNELKKRNIPYKKLEVDLNGKPKLGKLHSFDIEDKPKDLHGFTLKGSVSGRPYLKGVGVYQYEQKDKNGDFVKNQKGQNVVKRAVFTFRTASESQRGTGQWQHPGNVGRFFLEEAYTWASDYWDNTVKVEILKSLGL